MVTLVSSKKPVTGPWTSSIKLHSCFKRLHKQNKPLTGNDSHEENLQRVTCLLQIFHNTQVML